MASQCTQPRAGASVQVQCSPTAQRPPVCATPLGTWNPAGGAGGAHTPQTTQGQTTLRRATVFSTALRILRKGRQ